MGRICATGKLVISRPTNWRNVVCHCEPTVNQVTCGVDHFDDWAQDVQFADRESVDIVPRAQPQYLGLVRIQTQSVCSHPRFYVSKTTREPVDSTLNVVHRRADVELTVVRVLVQSRTPTGDTSPISAVYRKNRKGPKLTPYNNGCVCDIRPLYATCWVCPVTNDVIHWRTVSVKQKFRWSLIISSWWSTQSNAAERSSRPRLAANQLPREHLTAPAALPSPLNDNGDRQTMVARQ